MKFAEVNNTQSPIVMHSPADIPLFAIVDSLLPSQRKAYDKLLVLLDDNTSSRCCLVTGRPGTGKTLITTALAHQYFFEVCNYNRTGNLPKKQPKHFFFLNGADVSTILSSLWVIAKELWDIKAFDWPIGLTEANMLTQLTTCLNNTTDWVLIVDNLQDKEAFNYYCGQLRHGIIIVTSASITDLGDALPGFTYTSIEVKLVSPAYSLGFIAYWQKQALVSPRGLSVFNPPSPPRYLAEYLIGPGIHSELGRQLITLLANTPFELRQAALYMSRNNCAPAQYLELCKKRLDGLTQNSNAERPVALAITWADIQRADQATSDLLVLLAFWGNSEIPALLIDETPQDCLTVDLKEAIRKNRSWLTFNNLGLYYGLVKYNPATESLCLSPAACDMIRAETPLEKQKEMAGVACKLLAAFVNEYPPDSPYHWPRYPPLRPLVLGLLTKQLETLLAGENLSAAIEFLKAFNVFEESQGILSADIRRRYISQAIKRLVARLGGVLNIPGD
jgi:Uncharacterized conserved protein (DUF2075)